MGFPLIRNYTPKEYKSSPVIRAAAQGARGLLYFGAGDGIVEYDGARWRSIPTDTRTLAFDVALSPSGRLYVSTVDDFGYLAEGKNGLLAYKGLAGLVKAADSAYNIGTLLDIKFAGGSVFFYSNNGIIEYSEKENKVWLYPATAGSGHSIGAFVHNDVYHVRFEKSGLFKVLDKKLVSCTQTSLFIEKNKFYKGAVSFPGDRVLLLPRKEPPFWFAPDAGAPPVPFVLSDTGFLSGNDLYSATSYDGARVLLNSFGQGSVMADLSGKVLQRYEKGLASAGTNIAVNDAQANIWLGTGAGISKAEAGLDLAFWDGNSGLEGFVFSVIRHKGEIYAGTLQKPYRLGADNRFFEIPGAPVGAVWCFLGAGGSLLMGTHAGLYEIKNGKAIEVLQSAHVYTMRQSQKDPRRVYLAIGSEGITSMLRENGVWKTEGRWEGIKEQVRSIVETPDGTLWLGTFSKGVLKVVPDSEDMPRPKSVRYYDQKDGFLTNKSCWTFPHGEGGVLFGSAKGFHAYDAGKDRIIPFPGFGEGYRGEKSPQVLHFSADGRGGYVAGPYGVSAATPITRFSKNAAGGWGKAGAEFARFPEMYVETLYTDSTAILWVGGSAGLFRYDAAKDEKDYGASFNCYIRKAIAGDSLLHGGGAGNAPPAIVGYGLNTLHLEFAAPFFDKENETVYSYMLEGFDGNWSDWSSKTEKEYTKVREGRYSFKVKAKNIYGVESTEAAYQIQILPPWQRTWWAYTLYAAATGLLFFGGLKVNSRRLEKDKAKLEALVEARTAEVVKQKEEITVAYIEISQQKEEIESIADNLKTANVEIQKSYHDISVLSEIGQEITSSLVLDSVLETVYKSVNELMDATVFGIGIVDSAKQEIEYRLAIEKGMRYKPYSRSMSDKNQLPVWCAEQQKEVFINNIFTEYGSFIDRYDDKRTELEDGTLSEAVTSMIYLPLLLEQKTLGIITVQSYRTDAYTLHNLAMLKTLASYIAIAIENSKSYGLVKEKNDHITDSIRYAKTIQQAILPTTAKIGGGLKEHFVFFSPKDIVSGDFYWYSSLEKEGVKYEFIAAVDCTGHGVPGAFMSMIGYSILNETVNEKGVWEPAEILEKLDAGVRLALRQEEKANEDGMDLCLARVETKPAGATLVFAGAKRPLYLHIPGENVLQEIKGTKRSIGGLQLKQRPFEQHETELPAGAMAYLFSDGFGDQSNLSNQKIGTPRLLEILLSNAERPCGEQFEQLKIAFNAFKGDSKQKDDVTVIGFRV